MKLSNIKKIRGQGMSEYLIIVALLAVAGITTFGFLSGAARNQVASVAQEISGETGVAERDAAQADAGEAATDAADNRGMGEFQDSNVRLN